MLVRYVAARNTIAAKDETAQPVHPCGEHCGLLLLLPTSDRLGMDVVAQHRRRYARRDRLQLRWRILRIREFRQRPLLFPARRRLYTPDSLHLEEPSPQSHVYDLYPTCQSIPSSTCPCFRFGTEPASVDDGQSARLWTAPRAWTISSEWRYIVGLLVIFTALVARDNIAALIKQHRTERSGLCRGCGYDLRATPQQRCPECGRPASLDPSVAASTAAR